MKIKTLPEGFNLRFAEWSDLDAVAQLIHAACKADGDESMTSTPAELAQDWKMPGFTLTSDAWVVTDPAGKVVGYEEFLNRFEHTSLRGDGYVHPTCLGLGIGTTLLKKLDARARREIPLAPPDLRVYLRNSTGTQEKNSHAIHLEAGFQAIRYAWRMEINLGSAPAPALWPGQIELRPFDMERDSHSLYLAHEDAFRDHWGHTPRSYEFWENRHYQSPDFDPGQCYLAWDGDQLAGYSLCRSRQGLGWVETLGVRRDWRKQGLGMALLKHSFGQFYQKGFDTVVLTVDASSPTGATRLYERAGMHIASEFVIFEKEYRPGLDPEEVYK